MALRRRILPQTRQPAQSLRMCEEYSDALIAFVPSANGLARDFKGLALSAPITRPTIVASVGGIGIMGEAASDRPYLQPATLLSTPSAATLISIQANYSGTGDFNLWHHFQGATDNLNTSLFGFSSQWFIATFSSSRWATPTIGSDFRQPHVAVVTAAGTNRAAYYRGRQVATSASGGAITISNQMIAGSDNAGFKSLQHTYAMVLLPRSLSPEEVQERFSTPAKAWASLFSSTRRRVWIAPPAPPTTPTLSAVTATDITATTARLRVTVTF